MDLSATADAYAALDEFLGVIFADEDLLEVAFESAIGSWDATPLYPSINSSRFDVAHADPSRTGEPQPDGSKPTGHKPEGERLATAYGPVASGPGRLEATDLPFSPDGTAVANEGRDQPVGVWVGMPTTTAR